MKPFKKMLTLAFITVVFGTALAQETRPSGPIKPSQSEFFISELAMVLVAQQEPTAIFALTLAAKKPLPSSSTIQVEFENPNPIVGGKEGFERRDRVGVPFSAAGHSDNRRVDVQQL